MEWFKFYGKDFLTDLKLQDLEWYDKLCFIYLMCYASQSTLPRNEIRDLTEDRFFKVLQWDSETVDNARGFMGRLEALHFVEITSDGGVILPNFEKRQAQAMTPYQRVKRYREKKKEEMITHDNDDNVNDNARVDKSRKEKNITNVGKTKFSLPSLKEVSDYCNERKNGIDAEQFINFYASKGWYVGKNKMKDWKAAVRTWERREKKGGGDIWV